MYTNDWIKSGLSRLRRAAVARKLAPYSTRTRSARKPIMNQNCGRTYHSTSDPVLHSFQVLKSDRRHVVQQRHSASHIVNPCAHHRRETKQEDNTPCIFESKCILFTIRVTNSQSVGRFVFVPDVVKRKVCKTDRQNGDRSIHQEAMAHSHRHQHCRFRECHLRLTTSTVLSARGKRMTVDDSFVQVQNDCCAPRKTAFVNRVRELVDNIANLLHVQICRSRIKNCSIFFKVPL